MDDCEQRWAEEEFRDVDLGDARLNRRLVSMARQVASQPSGRVTRVFGVSAEREAAFRLIENHAVSPTEIARASAAATARRCRGADVVIVPIDTTVLTITDPADAKGFGPVCGKEYEHRGAYVMNALAVSKDGTTRGLLEQIWWTRAHEPVARGRALKSDRRPLERRETIHWVHSMRASARVLAEQQAARPWFQMDRGADCYSVLTEIVDHGWLATVRSSYDRRCDEGYLSTALASPTHQSWTTVEIARAPGRPARVAQVRLRARPVVVRATFKHHATRQLAFNLVEVREMSPPRGVEPIRWRLLTTHAIATEVDVLDVVSGYAKRWHIETFHNAWKSGTTNVETSQLRHIDHFRVWATLLATVAARAERLKHRARSEPDVSALEEFSRDEIDAAILLRKPKGVVLGATPTLGEMVRWVADWGGYTGKSSGGPPGTIVISRGLERIAVAAETIAAMRATSG
jgi:hypothetical protein